MSTSRGALVWLLGTSSTDWDSVVWDVLIPPPPTLQAHGSDLRYLQWSAVPGHMSPPVCLSTHTAASLSLCPVNPALLLPDPQLVPSAEDRASRRLAGSSMSWRWELFVQKLLYILGELHYSVKGKPAVSSAGQLTCLWAVFTELSKSTS